MTDSLQALSFFSAKSKPLDDEAAATAAVVIEKEAYVKTIADSIDGTEAVRAYAATASSLVLASIKERQEATGFAELTPASLDISGGAREFLTKERAEELLAPLLASDSKITKVKLSGKSFGRDASAIAGKALSAAQGQLMDVDLSDIIAGRPEEEALASLRTICEGLRGSQLAALDLSDNALGEKGVRACQAAIEGQTALQSLSFCNNGISEEAAAAIAELVSCSTLKKLHFYNNMSGDAGARHVANVVTKARNLVDFQMACSRVGGEGGAALAEALAGDGKLQRLDLHDNIIGEEGGLALAKMLSSQQQLRVLNLSEIGLGDAATAAIAKALSSAAPLLEVLELACDEITADAAPALAACLRAKSQLRRLVLSENELGDKGAVHIASALSSSHSELEEVRMNQNEICRVGAVALAKAVAGKPKLSLLDINSNKVSEAGVEAVKAAFHAAGQTACLGPLDENEEDEEEEEEGEEEVEEQDEETEKEDDELAAQMSHIHM
eukprot:jgi/Chlat1/7836/Chrsp66S09173